MADIKRTIEILFEGTNKTGTLITSIEKDLYKLNRSVGDMTAPFATITKGVVALDAALVALAAGGVAVSTSKYKDFNDVMLKVSGIMDASESEFSQLNQLTKDLGATTRFTAKEAAEGLEFLARAGFNFEDSMGALPETLKLAQASATDLGATADIVTNIMAGYGVAVDELAGTGDVLTATFTNSNTTLQELGDAFRYVGPVAKGMGVKIEETSAILGKLADAGYKGEQGGTALRNILLALTSPMGNAGKLMKELGVNTEELGIDLASSAAALKSMGVVVKDAEGNLRPFDQIMDDLKDGLEKLQGPADRTAVLVEIFGKRGGPQMAALLGQGSDAVVNLRKKLDESAGTMDRIADKMESDIGGAVRSMNSAFESVLLDIGERFSSGLIDPIRDTTTFLRALTLSINEGAFDPVFDAFEDFAEELGDTLADIAENLPAALEEIEWGGLVDSLGDMGDTVKGLFEGVDISTPEGVAAALQLVVDGLTKLVDVSTGIGSIFVNVAGYIAGLAENFSQLDSSTVTTVAKFVGIGAAISALLVPISSGVTALRGLGTAFTLLSANPIVAGLVAIGAAIYGVVEASNWLVEKMTGVNVELAGVGDSDGPDKLAGKFGDIGTAADGAADKIKAIPEKTGEATQKVGEDSKDAATEIFKLKVELEKIGGVLVEPEVNVKGADEAKQKFKELEYWVGDEGAQVRKTMTVAIETDTESVDEAKKKLDEKIPAVKRLEIETDLKIAEIEAQAETVQTALEWQAKVDIAQVEADIKQFEAVAQNISDMFAGTGELISGLFSQWDSDASLQEKWAIQEQIDAETENRAALLKMQQELTQAQVKFLEARTKQMESGEALITVNGDGLAPHLEMIMWEVLSAVQVRASQEGLNQLLLGA